MYQVLFAEDELLVRLGLQKAIPWERFHMELTAQADNGLQALELFQSMRPDVVITDICMAGMDGYELIQRIREMDADCAIIVISCLEDFETLRKMIPYKIIGYIAKAGMSLEDVHKLLQEAKEYLDKIGRPDRQQGRAEKSVEEQLVRYFTEDGAELSWSGQSDIRELLLFSIAKEDREKVNDLAMRFFGGTDAERTARKRGGTGRPKEYLRFDPGKRISVKGREGENPAFGQRLSGDYPEGKRCRPGRE